MTKVRSHLQQRALFFIFLSALVGVLCWMTYLRLRQIGLNIALVAALNPTHAHRTTAAEVKRLLDAGADSGSHAYLGQSSFWEELVRVFSGQRVTNVPGEPALALALEWEVPNEPICQLLVDHGAAVNINVGTSAMRPVHIAVRTGMRRLLDSLLAHKADINVDAGNGDTPLACAVDRIDIGMVEKLLGHGADPNATRKDGTTPLMFACRRSSVPVVTALLDHGAKVNLKDELSNTALIYAVFWGRPSALVKALRVKGADVTARNKHGDTALQIAKKVGKPAVQRLLTMATN